MVSAESKQREREKMFAVCVELGKKKTKKLMERREKMVIVKKK